MKVKTAQCLEYASPESVNMDPVKLNKVEEITQNILDLKEKYMTGMNIVVARHGKIVYEKAFGKLYLREDSPPAPVDAIYPIFSVSKPITAALIMILCDKGLLDVNDPVQKYITEFKGRGKSKVKIRHLLTHTSGMCEDDIYKYIDEIKDSFVLPQKIPEYLNNTKRSKRHLKYWLMQMHAPLTKPLGKEMSYCSLGYNMLGMIIEIISGKSLNLFGKTALFTPLGMKDTSYKKTSEQIKDRVIERIPNSDEKVSWMNQLGCFKYGSASGGVSSTAYDLTIFGQMMLNKGIYNGKRILSERSVELMTTNQIPRVPAVWGEETFKEAAWGYGFNTTGVQDNFPTNQTYYHGGYCGSRIFVDPITELVVVFLKVLREENLTDFDGVFQAVVESCTDYESLKTPPVVYD